MPIPNFQYSWPDKESRPESHTCALFFHCLCVRYSHRSGHCLAGLVRSFFMLNTRPPIDIIQSTHSYKYVTSVVWYASQTVADCLISCKSHFSSGDAGPISRPCSFPCTCTPKGSKWYAKIRHGGEIPHTQYHPNCCARDYLVNCGARVLVLVETHSNL